MENYLSLRSACSIRSGSIDKKTTQESIVNKVNKIYAKYFHYLHSFILQGCDTKFSTIFSGRHGLDGLTRMQFKLIRKLNYVHLYTN